MTNKASESSPAGWVVQLSSPRADSAPSFRFFNVAIQDADEAVAIVREKTKATTLDRVYAVRPLSSRELAMIKIRSGEAKPA